MQAKNMKKLYYLFWTVSLLVLFSFQCSKEADYAEFTGKIALEGICGRTVVTITSGNLAQLPANTYAASWQDPTTGIVYQDVFLIANICQLQPVLKKDDIITFRVHPQPDTTCITCLAYSPAPTQQLPIEIFSHSPRG
jgi:hypothetical protein